MVSCLIFICSPAQSSLGRTEGWFGRWYIFYHYVWSYLFVCNTNLNNEISAGEVWTDYWHQRRLQTNNWVWPHTTTFSEGMGLWNAETQPENSLIQSRWGEEVVLPFFDIKGRDQQEIFDSVTSFGYLVREGAERNFSFSAEQVLWSSWDCTWIRVECGTSLAAKKLLWLVDPTTSSFQEE